VKHLLLIALTGLTIAACGGVGGPTGWGGPVEVDELIVVPDNDGNLLGRGTDGDLRWLFPDESVEDAVGESVDLEAIYGNPGVDGERIYVGGFDHYLYALDLDGGEPELAWRFRTEGDIVGGPAINPTTDLIVVGSGDHSVYGVTSEGEEVWRFGTGERIWSTPAFGDELVYIGSMDHSLYALDLEGQEVWSFETDAAIGASPVVDGDQVYIGSFDRSFYALDASSGELLWEFETDNWIWAAPLVEGDIVYVPSFDGSLYALSRDDGELLWEVETGSGIRGRPSLAGDTLVVANQRGDILGLDASSGEERWRIDQATEADVLSDLSLIREYVYVRDEDGNLLEVDPEVGESTSFGEGGA
jgi:outer membrane protein assembly factor BamB